MIRRIGLVRNQTHRGEVARAWRSATAGVEAALVSVLCRGSRAVHSGVCLDHQRQPSSFITDISYVDQMTAGKRSLNGEIPVLRIRWPHSVFDGQDSGR